MTEYVFSNGRLTIRRDATLRSGRPHPHALRPAFMVLEPPPEMPSSDPADGRPEEGEDDEQEDS